MLKYSISIQLSLAYVNRLYVLVDCHVAPLQYCYELTDLRGMWE
jgi:hypothetical protein